MAHDGMEIEIKVALDREAFLKLRERLKAVAKTKGRSNHVDRCYTPAHRNFMEPRFPFEWLSVRRRGDRAILTYKHWHPENSEMHTHCDEFETVVERPEQLERLLSALDLREMVTVEKEREVFIYRDEFEVTLDVVKGLGHFVELETVKDFGSVEASRKRLFDFARTLGIDISGLDRRGYPYQLMMKRGLVK
jgi:adenylate cyclase class 2